jgi:hypothetical protein
MKLSWCRTKSLWVSRDAVPKEKPNGRKTGHAGPTQADARGRHIERRQHEQDLGCDQQDQWAVFHGQSLPLKIKMSKINSSSPPPPYP